MNIGVVLGVRAAHRLDRGRVWCFPDRAVRPGEIRRRCLKNRSNTKSTVNSCSSFHAVHCKTVSQKKQKQDSLFSQFNQQQAPADKHALFCVSCRSWSFMTYDFLRSCWDRHSSWPWLRATSSLLTAKTCTSSASCHTEINTHNLDTHLLTEI